MDPETKSRAETIITKLCVGRSICGLRFVAEPVLILGAYENLLGPPPAGPSEVYLHIESGATISHERRQSPGTIESLAQFASCHRGLPIVAISLASDMPTLTLSFKGGAQLIIEGYHDEYEVWSLAADDWSVYALAKGQITWPVPHPALALDAV